MRRLMRSAAGMSGVDGGKMRSRSASPPTRRVIDVVELLSASDRRYSVTEIAATLNITRATAVAVLAELQSAGWVSRGADRTYSRGPDFDALVDSRSADADTDYVHGVLSKLSKRLKCGLSVSAVDPTSFMVLHKAQVTHQPVIGFAVGQRNPLRFPAGAAVLARRATDEQQAWWETAPELSAAQRRRLLQLARDCEAVLYRPVDENAAMVGLLGKLLSDIGGDNLQPQLRGQLLDQIATLSSGAIYSAGEIDDRQAMPLSYLTVPIADEGGRAMYELQIAPLSPDVARQRRHDLIAAALGAAADLRGHRIRPCRHRSRRCR